MSEGLNQLMSGLFLLFSKPFLLLLLVLFFGGLSYFHGSIRRRNLRKMEEGATSGWETPAQQALRPHETGIGTRDVKVMRPPRRFFPIVLFGMVLIAGSIYLLWNEILGDLQNSSGNPIKTLEAYVALICSAFLALLSPLGLWFAFHRIEVSKSEILLRRLFCPRRQYFLSSLASVAPIGPNAVRGVKLHFSDGRTLKLLASFRGYAEVLQLIKHTHPDLQCLYSAGRFQHLTQKHAVK